MVQLRIKSNKWLETTFSKNTHPELFVSSVQRVNIYRQSWPSAVSILSLLPECCSFATLQIMAPFCHHKNNNKCHQNASHAIQCKSLQWVCSDLYLVLVSRKQQYFRGFLGYPPCSELHNYFVYSLFLLAGNKLLRWGTPALSHSLKPRRSSQGRRYLLPSAGELELGTKGASQTWIFALLEPVRRTCWSTWEIFMSEFGRWLRKYWYFCWMAKTSKGGCAIHNKK